MCVLCKAKYVYKAILFFFNPYGLNLSCVDCVSFVKWKLKSISVNPSFIHRTMFSSLGTQDYSYRVFALAFALFFHAIHERRIAEQVSPKGSRSRLILQVSTVPSVPLYVATVAFTLRINVLSIRT